MRTEDLRRPAEITVENVEKMPSPRIIKTHLPFYLLNPKLLETSKVNLLIHVNFERSLESKQYRLFTWPEIPKTLLSPSTTMTN